MRISKMRNAIYAGLCKLMQKQTYDFLSHRHGIVLIVVGTVVIIVSALQFGETALEWSQDKYGAIFNSFSDNVAGRSFQNRLCQPVPIDVVYTWVNGTDPKMLAELRHYKMNLESEINKTSGKPECPFHHCIPWHFVVIEPAIPLDINIDAFSILYPAFKGATRTSREVVGEFEPSNVTFVWFEDLKQAQAAAESKVKIDNVNATVFQGYLTSEWPLPISLLSKDLIIMGGIPHDVPSEKLAEKFPATIQKVLSKVEWYLDQGVAVLNISDHDVLQQMTEGKVNMTFDGKEPLMNAASLVWDLTDYRHNDVLSANRFQDNEELRYSLRSVERYAPWVRHVYIVTNGQIPSWLNLDNPRLNIITHQELFVNKSHLPTFASPAIESHLHRIPGLSDKFIYLNDDVMFGKEVWPEDFYTHSNGQKVYLTWPVPDCLEGCPGSWIKDGYCDKACNNSACEWDGGDCAAGASQSNNFIHNANAWGSATDDLYCSGGCANNWLADHYCDESCNVAICGFDAGDCGMHNFHRLHRLDIHKNETWYRIPRGVSVAYLNLTQIYGSDGVLEEGTYDDNPAIRVATLSQKFKTMSVVLFKKFNETVLHFAIKGKELNKTSFDFNFNVTMDPWPLGLLETKPEAEEEKISNHTVPDTAAHVNISEIAAKFEEVADELRQPSGIKKHRDTEDLQTMNLTLYELPEHIADEWLTLVKSLKDGDITEKGFTLGQANITKKFLSILAKNGTSPRLRKLNPEIVDAGVKPEAATGDDIGDAKEDEDGGQIDGLVDDEIKPGGADQDQPVNAIEHDQELPPKGDTVEQQNKLNDTQKHASYNDSVPFKSRKLNGFDLSDVGPDDSPGFLPWEKQNSFAELNQALLLTNKQDEYRVEKRSGRFLLDTFAESLRHTNRLYNQAYGYAARKVPAHMPHMIDKHIMAELQAKFPKEWADTSSHALRSPQTMQFSFSYMYYMMSEKKEKYVEDIFATMDTDRSGVLSDREIRTLATTLYELPLDLQTLTSLESKLINCSNHLPASVMYVPSDKVEVYYDKDMPQVTRSLVTKCDALVKVMAEKFPDESKYRFEIVGDGEVAFKMIETNVSRVVGQLDDIRKNPKKFICLNDNLDHSKEHAQMVKAVLHDFYESILPIPSSFELSREYRNRFLRMDELEEWRKYRDWLKLWTQLALLVLILYTIWSFFGGKIESFQRRYFSRHSGNSGSQPDDKSIVFHL